jgi:hypothetical protein
MIYSALNRDVRIVRLSVNGVHPKLEEVQGLRSSLG